MKKKGLVFILLMLLAALRCLANDVKLRGTVVSSADGSPVPFANVMVYALPDSALLGYAITSDDGSFLVEATSSSTELLIKVSCIGFKSKTARTTREETNGVLVKLEPNSKMLETIVVTGRAPGIKVSGDTIDYNIGKYTTGNEKVLKDILAKLPGMDVDEKGQVTVNGEAVKKILIDGQDFFGDKNE